MFIIIYAMNSVTLIASAKHDLLFIEPASGKTHESEQKGLGHYYKNVAALINTPL